MISDDFENEIAVSMDDLESLDTSAISAVAAAAHSASKLTKFQRPTLPEIDENATYDSSASSTANVSPVSSDILIRGSTNDFMVPGIDLRKTVLLNNSASEILSQSLNSIDQNANAADDDSSSDFRNNNNSSNNNNIDVWQSTKSVTDKSDNTKSIDNNGTEKPKRKFIVTRMDSKVLLRPEAEQLRNFSAKTNAATISFPCSAKSNQRMPLSSLFAEQQSFEPHLDKRFFDTSLVRINAVSTQSLNTTAKHDNNQTIHIDSDIWQRRKGADTSVKVKLVVSGYEQFVFSICFFCRQSIVYVFPVLSKIC